MANKFVKVSSKNKINYTLADFENKYNINLKNELMLILNYMLHNEDSIRNGNADDITNDAFYLAVSSDGTKKTFPCTTFPSSLKDSLKELVNDMELNNVSNIFINDPDPLFIGLYVSLGKKIELENNPANKLAIKEILEELKNKVSEREDFDEDSKEDIKNILKNKLNIDIENDFQIVLKIFTREGFIMDSYVIKKNNLFSDFTKNKYSILAAIESFMIEFEFEGLNLLPNTEMSNDDIVKYLNLHNILPNAIKKKFQIMENSLNILKHVETRTTSKLINYLFK